MALTSIDPNEIISCKCGCGIQFPKYRRGHGEWIERKYYKSSHTLGNQYGSNNYNYKGGYLDKKGYLCIGRKNNKAHRRIYEEYYNCCLLPWIDIHHIDGNKLNNDITNLKPITHSQHSLLTWQKRKGMDSN